MLSGAGKPNFYTDDTRPFREICLDTGRLLFQKVERFEKGKVYTEGCLKELSRLMDWNTPASVANGENLDAMSSVAQEMSTADVLYIGDSLFADLVDAKREFGWTTAAVIPEVGYEMEIEHESDFELSQKTIEILLNALRLVQAELGTAVRTKEDSEVMDAMERLGKCCLMARRIILRIKSVVVWTKSTVV